MRYVPKVNFKLESIPNFKKDFPLPDISQGESYEPKVSSNTVNYVYTTSIFDVY
jgi:hypothetical protein